MTPDERTEHSYLDYTVGVKLMGHQAEHTLRGRVVTVKFKDFPRWWRSPLARLRREMILDDIRDLLPKGYSLLVVQG